MSNKLLQVENLSVYTTGGKQIIQNVSFDLSAGECVCLCGESGCGKTTTLLATAGLWQGRIAGRVLFEGEDLLTLGERQLCALRGRRIAMVFQDPLAALNPVLRVGRQMQEALRVHCDLSARELHTRCLSLLERVRLPATEELLRSYPHELSGGMAQRVVIAIALSCAPALILADEPTSALDEATGSQIVALLRELVRDRGMSLLVSTHQKQLFSGFADRTLSLSAGRMIPFATSADL